MAVGLNEYAIEMRRLYRHCLRTALRIPESGAKIYYRNHANTHFLQHLQERDPSRIEALLQRGYHDVNWITRKYKLEPHRMPESRFNITSGSATPRR